MILKDLELLSDLGQGKKRKTARLFLMQDKTSKTKYVLKIIDKNKVNVHLIELIRSEKELQINGIIDLPVFWEENEVEIQIVRKYFEGQTLEDHIKTLNKSQMKLFLIKFIPAFRNKLNIIHASGIIHCDVKPSNILIDVNENGFEVTLIDFAFAHYIEIKIRPKIYALGYSAPELLLNSIGNIGSHTDYFSLGILIYKILSGKLPLIHPNPAIMTNLQLTHPLPEDSKISRKILEILNKLTEKPQFKNSPNNLSKEEIEKLLVFNISKRSNHDLYIEELITELKKPKISFLKKIFSKTNT